MPFNSLGTRCHLLGGSASRTKQELHLRNYTRVTLLPSVTQNARTSQKTAATRVSPLIAQLCTSGSELAHEILRCDVVEELAELLDLFIFVLILDLHTCRFQN